MSDTSVKKGAWKLAAAVVVMFGFGYLLVPLYTVFCDITGLRYTEDSPESVAADIVEDTSRTIKVEFDSSLNQGMAWDFEPDVHSIEIHPGRLYNTQYFAKNRTGHTMVGRAVPSITPLAATKYFVKTECFCFSYQTLEPGESREMPLIFMVKPNLPKDVKTVTLSYTFFDATELGETEDKNS
jgi:cytochrome c oxidase assembly protein subunit 11